MTSAQLTEKFLEFFKQKGHAIIPSAPLVPEGDASVLFNTAGMQPLQPYLLGAPHPSGRRLANIQKCLRTGDIDDVGDDTHCTFFEMLGNWSLGDYFKTESIAWSWEFLTSPQWMALDPKKISVTVFAGDENAPRDEESAQIWQSLGMPKERIAYLGAADNWWAAGATGPCGPDTEIFYWVGEGLPPAGSNKGNDPKNWMEIWNNVFMEYNRVDEKTLNRLPNKNVDTGMGLERVTATLNGTKSVYEVDSFAPVIAKMKDLVARAGGTYAERSARIIADHLRAAVHLISDGVVPKNVEQGYVLRRLIRRAIREAYQMRYEEPFLATVAQLYIDFYRTRYTAIAQNEAKIKEELTKEEERFAKTLKQGMAELEKLLQHKAAGAALSGQEAFWIFETYGFPKEMIAEICRERGLGWDEAGYQAAWQAHQEKSRTAAEGKFKGGLAGNDEATVALHTACHLMLAALRKTLGTHVFQAGSNITPERLRFDFTHPQKMTPEEVAKVEGWVNEKIAAGFVVKRHQEPKEAARARGVVGSFWDKYPDPVQIYTIQGNSGEILSEELCGGPHVENSGQLGAFKIQKEESSSAGVRRIKAVLTK